MTQRSGVSYVPITIKVQSPSGGVYNALLDSAEAATPITDIQVKSSPYYTDPIWDTGIRAIYPPGTYTIWAECNVNSMKDNYGQIGKTISQQVSLLNQDQNPRIVNSGYVTNPTTQVTTIVTTSLPTISATVTTASVTTPPAPVTTIISSTTTPIESVPATITTAATPKTTISPGFDGILVALVCYGRDNRIYLSKIKKRNYFFRLNN